MARAGSGDNPPVVRSGRETSVLSMGRMDWPVATAGLYVANGRSIEGQMAFCPPRASPDRAIRRARKDEL
jgi:hypothetical protein